VRPGRGGVSKFKGKGSTMATRSISLFVEERPFSASPRQALEARPEDLSAIYTAHHRAVLQVCRRFFRQREDAEDAAAEVFLKLHRVLEKKDPATPLRPWLAQVAARHCIDKLRQRKREKSCCSDGIDVREVPDDLTPSPLSQFLSREKQLQVMEQLNRLPEHYRISLVLRYYQRMSYAQIAGALNSRLPAVRMMIFRAKDQLRRNLGVLGRPQIAAGPQQMD
jgi:RNA polymerase sigma-70 factor, ECF subfamily